MQCYYKSPAGITNNQRKNLQKVEDPESDFSNFCFKILKFIHFFLKNNARSLFFIKHSFDFGMLKYFSRFMVKLSVKRVWINLKASFTFSIF